MTNRWRAGLVILLAGMLLASAAAGETEERASVATEVPGPGAEWNLDEKGFLVGENPEKSWMLEDEENGVWAYSDAHLSIRMKRYTDPVGKKLKRLYCVAEIFASKESPLYPILHPQVKNDPFPGCNKQQAEVLLADYPSVLAVSDDYYGHRYQTRIKKGAKWPVGIIIRNGKVFFDMPRDSSKKPEFPPLDTLAVYEDGSMKVYISDELTAEQYLADGAVNVFSFGPWLIRDGEVNTKGAVGDKARYATLRYSDARVAIGMVEPFHYILIVVSVPNEKKNIGAKGEWLIEKLQEYGCTEAFNLDGGGTTCLAFNGKVILRGDGSKRPLSGMIAFGNLE